MNTQENMIFLNLKYATKDILCCIYVTKGDLQNWMVCHEVVQVSVIEGHPLITKWMQRLRAESCLIVGILTFVLILAVC